jgi:hypothetical protein
VLPKLVYLALCRTIPTARPARSRRGRQGLGDPGAAPATHRPAAPGPTTKGRARRPGPVRRDQPHALKIQLVLLLRQARDPAALAPSAGRRRLDLPTPSTGTSATGRARAAVDRSPGAGNPRWGYQRIKGELLRLGMVVSATAVRATLRRHGLDPAPRRASMTWRVFLR